MNVKRLIGGVVIAVLTASTAGTADRMKRHTVVHEGILDALCAAVEKDGAEYILLGCFLLPKPPAQPSHAMRVLL